MKICGKCKIEKTESDYYRRKDGRGALRSWCKVCYRDHSRAYVKTPKSKVARKTLNVLYKKKVKARGILNRSIYRGEVVKLNICMFCKNSPTDCHHEDYNKPLEFLEMCKPCHLRFHADLKP